MKSHAHRLTEPVFTSTSSGIDVAGKSSDGRQVRLHLFTATGLDPNAETNRLTAGAMTTNEVIVSTRSADTTSLDGAVIDAARSGKFASYANPSEAMFPKKNAFAGIMSKLSGRDEDERRAWRSMQSEVLHSLPSGEPNKPTMGASTNVAGSQTDRTRDFIQSRNATIETAERDVPVTGPSVDRNKQASVAAFAARQQGMG